MLILRPLPTRIGLPTPLQALLYRFFDILSRQLHLCINREDKVFHAPYTIFPPNQKNRVKIFTNFVMATPARDNPARVDANRFWSEGRGSESACQHCQRHYMSGLRLKEERVLMGLVGLLFLYLNLIFLPLHIEPRFGVALMPGIIALTGIGLGKTWGWMKANLMAVPPSRA